MQMFNHKDKPYNLPFPTGLVKSELNYYNI